VNEATCTFVQWLYIPEYLSWTDTLHSDRSHFKLEEECDQAGTADLRRLWLQTVAKLF